MVSVEGNTSAEMSGNCLVIDGLEEPNLGMDKIITDHHSRYISTNSLGMFNGNFSLGILGIKKKSK